MLKKGVYRNIPLFLTYNNLLFIACNLGLKLLQLISICKLYFL